MVERFAVQGRLAVATCIGVLTMLGLAAHAEARGVHPRCGSFKSSNGRVYVSAKGISCMLALRLQKAYFLAPESEKELVGPDSYNGYVRLKKFPGWHCTSGAMAGDCVKGHLEAPYYDGPPDTASTPCGSLPIDYSPTPEEHYGREYLTAPLTVSCATAKRLVLRYEHHRSGCQGNSCSKTYPDGWTCQAAMPGEWPSILACEKGGAQVSAQVRSKIKGPR